MTNALPSEEEDRLLSAADRVRQRAHAPYSSFRVGAAVLTAAGETFIGCNVESASYGLTLCAERAALAAWRAGSADGAERGLVSEVRGGAGGGDSSALAGGSDPGASGAGAADARAGGNAIIAVALSTEADSPTSPCGACRQWLAELAPDAIVIAATTTAARRARWTVAELLPGAFTGASLRDRPEGD